MSEQGFPPQPPSAPRPPETPVPTVPSAQPVYSTVGTPQVVPPRRSKAWIGWTIGIVLVLVLVVGSCALPMFLLFDEDLDLGAMGERVAVIRLDGVIVGTGDYYSGYVTPESFWDMLDQAVTDDSVKAIVLKVDSPGGTVAASEEIARYVAECEKPVIVSSGDINASGAYMVSSQADEIWALPGTAVGSIGVIAEIPNVAGLLDKLGVEFAVITAGENKDTGSPYRPLTKNERALIQGEVDEAYAQFIELVADGRDMKRSEVESLATGWTWSGERALELGLIDEVGTHRDALDAAAEAGGIEGDYDTVSYEPEYDSLFRSLIGLSAGLQRLAAVAEDSAGVDARTRLPR